MNIKTFSGISLVPLVLAFAGAVQAQGKDPSAHASGTPQRQAEVANRGKDVMPFSLNATTHFFTKTSQGGVQQVVAKNASEEAQVKLVRQHLQEIRGQFLKGDFSGPAHVHGRAMPGLVELQSAKPGQIAIAYKDVPGGAALTYETSQAALVTALHKWFDAQLADHGKDAMAGHGHHPGHHK
jgi:hypothetical protein